MSNTKDPLNMRVAELKRFTRNRFKELFPTRKEQREHKEVLDETLDQLYYCECLCRPVTKTQITEWLMCNNVFAVQRKARTHKGFT